MTCASAGCDSSADRPRRSADRAFLQAVFGGHPYGRGGLGTTRSLLAMTLDEARAFWTANFGPARATLLLAGDITPAAAMSAANAAFGVVGQRRAAATAAAGAERRGPGWRRAVSRTIPRHRLVRCSSSGPARRSRRCASVTLALRGW